MSYQSDICQFDKTLRNYQQEAKEKIFKAWESVDNILYQMPTGTGKTRLFTSIIRDINIWGLKQMKRPQILIIAHRSELIDQIDKSLNKYHIPHGIISGNHKKERNFTLPTQVASIQTITHHSNKIITDVLNIDYIIIDEAHHAIANSYSKLWNLFPNSKKLGVTATPWRMNNEGFTKNFDLFLPSMPIKEFMNLGWLAPYQYYSIEEHSPIQEAISNIHEFNFEGDYKTKALENAIDKEHIRAQLFQSYKKYAFGKKGIIYSISRLHSEHICARYRAEGISIANIDSETPSSERERLVNDFKNGVIEILVNVDIFSEGFDCPDIEFIQLARPTRSLVKYIQQVGRGLRKNGDKTCIILDNVGMYSQFGLPDQDRDWESYFYGLSSSEQRQSPRHKMSSVVETERNIDLSEGAETMTLIQDKISPTIPSGNDVQKLSQEEDMGVSTEVIFETKRTKYSIQSRTFNNGKYRIEETESGFYLIKVSTKKSILLMPNELNASNIGEIIIETHSKDAFVIVKVKEFSKQIIGYLDKEGMIMRFSSFDGKISKKNVSL